MTLTPQIFTFHPNAIFKKLAILKNIRSVEMKPLLKINNLNWRISQDYCNKYMKAFISSKLNLQFTNVNKEKIKIMNGIISNYNPDEHINYVLLPNKRLVVESYNELSGNFEYQDIKDNEIGIIKPKYYSICDIYSDEIVNHGKGNV